MRFPSPVEKAPCTPSGRTAEVPVRFSCVVDRHPKFASQAWIWSTTLLRIAGRQPHEVVVHVVEGADGQHLDALREAGAHLVPVPRFDARHPHSNKLSQLESSAFDQAELVVLTDCDIAFADELDGLLSGPEMVAAKRVDTGKPSHDHWKSIFTSAGFDEEPRLALSTHTLEPTFVHNFNGGVYVLRREAFEALREAWPRWTRWLLDRPKLLGRYGFYTDQVSFGLATHELGLSVRELPSAYNYPTQHDDPWSADPVLLHYHERLDRSGLLRLTGRAPADAKIHRVNQVLVDAGASRSDPVGKAGVTR
jgi:hypothetical protein